MRSSMFAVALLALGAPPAPAAVPLKIPVQGVIRDNAGVPVADDIFAVRFALYASIDAVNPIWVEHQPPQDVDCADLPQTCVRVNQGVFRVHLATWVPLDSSLFSQTGQLWLGVRVETDPELPRQPLGSTPYALHSGSAANLACSGCLEVDALSASALDALRADALAAVEALGYVTADGALVAVATQGYVTAQGAVDAV